MNENRAEGERARKIVLFEPHALVRNRPVEAACRELV